MNNSLRVLLDNAINNVQNNFGDKSNILEKMNQASDPIEKLKFFLQFFAIEFPTSKFFYNADTINEFLHKLLFVTNECPSDFYLFMKWLPSFIQKKNESIRSIQKRVSILQKHIRELLNYISTYNISNNILDENEKKIFSDLNFLEENELPKHGNNKLNNYIPSINEKNDQNNEIDQKLNQNGECKDINNVQFLNFKNQDESLKKQNEKLQIQIENYKIKIASLLEELSNKEDLNRKVEEIEAVNNDLKKMIFQKETKYQSIIMELKQALQKQNHIIKSNRKNQEESHLSRNDINNELIHLNFLLEKYQKENEVYKSRFIDLINIFQVQDSTEIELNIENQSKFLKEKFFLMKEENIKIKIEYDKMKEYQNSLHQKIFDLESSFQKVVVENEQLKNELQAIENLSSSSIYETIDRLKCQNDELRKSFLKIAQNNFHNLQRENIDGKQLKSVSTSTSSTQLNEPVENSFSFTIFKKSDQNSLLSINNENQSIVHAKENEINCLKRKIVSLEAEKIKLAESLKKFGVKKSPESNSLDLKKIGFLLADALCQRYNPSRVPFEIKRLIEVARSEHIKLNESERVPIDPFNHYNEELNVNFEERADNSNNKKNIFSGFDELDCQISAIKSYM